MGGLGPAPAGACDSGGRDRQAVAARDQGTAFRQKPPVKWSHPR
jgi:hypothetical protein